MTARDNNKPTLENNATEIKSLVPVFVEIDARVSTLVATVMSPPGNWFNNSLIVA